MKKRYKPDSDKNLPCYTCKHNAFENENCYGCINDKGTVYSKWENMDILKKPICSQCK